MGKPTKKAMKDFLRVLRPHDEFVALALSKGIWFNGRANAEDYEITQLWQRVKRPKAGECYTNAQTFCLEAWDHRYFEGYVLAVGIPIQHAWVVLENGRVVDFTLEAMERKAKRAKVACDTTNALYLGVEVPNLRVSPLRVQMPNAYVGMNRLNSAGFSSASRFKPAPRRQRASWYSSLR